METLLTKLFSMLVEPTQIILVLVCGYLIYDKNKLLKINDKMLLAQQERGIVLGKITLMTEIIFKTLLSDARRDK